jgi:hypothetical protein
LQNRVKVPASRSLFHLVAVDMFSFEDPSQRYNLGSRPDNLVAQIEEAAKARGESVPFTLIINMVREMGCLCTRLHGLPPLPSPMSGRRAHRRHLDTNRPILPSLDACIFMDVVHTMIVAYISVVLPFALLSLISNTVFSAPQVIPTSYNLSAVCYFQPSDPAWREKDSPAVKLLEQFISGTDSFRNNRFKLIPTIVDGRCAPLSFPCRKMLGDWIDKTAMFFFLK